MLNGGFEQFDSFLQKLDKYMYNKNPSKLDLIRMLKISDRNEKFFFFFFSISVSTALSPDMLIINNDCQFEISL